MNRNNNSTKKIIQTIITKLPSVFIESILSNPLYFPSLFDEKIILFRLIQNFLFKYWLFRIPFFINFWYRYFLEPHIIFITIEGEILR